MRIALLMILLLLISISSVISGDMPKIINLNIIPPDPGLPEQVKAFSGTWKGKWTTSDYLTIGSGRKGRKLVQQWDCVIYVEKINNSSAQLVHAWGEYNTSRGSCHCSPNWLRIKDARVTNSEGKATIEYITPPFETKRVMGNTSREIKGSIEEVRTMHETSVRRGRYDFSFTIEKDNLNRINGLFVSGKGSRLTIEMEKTDQ